MLKLLLLLALGAIGLWWARRWLRGPGTGARAMTLDEARALLGVGPADGPEAIRQAYRARMATAHPDRGGAHGDAARLNAARDMALMAAQERTGS